VDISLVRPMILRSWERCRQAGFPSHGIDLYPIDLGVLREAVQHNHDLVESAKLLMDKLVLSIHMSKSVVTLVDDKGLVLHVSATTQDLKSVPYGEAAAGATRAPSAPTAWDCAFSSSARSTSSPLSTTTPLYII
jgi:transcriptional regulator of acetoin/glycerol metabolism